MIHFRSFWFQCCFFCVYFLVNSCRAPQQKIYKIGVSQLGEGDAWRVAMKEEMERELVFHPQLNIIYKEAGYDSKTQIRQIEELVADKIDVLIVSPNEAQPLTAVVEKIYKSGIPVIVVDRSISSDSYTTFIGSDNTEVGRLAASYAAHYLKHGKNIVELTGLISSTPAREREKGFAEELSKYPGFKVTVVNGNWLEGSVKDKLPSLKHELENTQLIFAHNDVMAETAAAICKQMGLNDIKIIGVDAQADVGLRYILAGDLLASVLYPTGGQEAIRSAAKIINHQTVPKRDTLRTIIVDSTNALMMTQQFNQIIDQQDNIAKREIILKQQSKIFRSQRNLITILFLVLSILFVISGMLIYLRRKNIIANRRLKLQNEKIIIRNRSIRQLAAQATEASEKRIDFFTNVVHDIKTPLTLIMAPAEDALSDHQTPIGMRRQFSLIKRNATRLLLLANQLIDFRKLELNKMEVSLQEIELVAFISEIIRSFEGLAHQRKIDCRLMTRNSSLVAWIDPEKIEKVFFNLLSNSFKFTGDGGTIYVFLSEDSARQAAIIKIEDSGKGINEWDQTRAFDLFYEGGAKHRPSGSGIGMALSKEFVEVHKGTISVSSRQTKGSLFTIVLPINEEDGRQAVAPRREFNSQISNWVGQYIADESDIPGAIKHDNDYKNYTVLIVEENIDLGAYMERHLSILFNVLAARDKRDGIRIAFEEVPDVVITDMQEVDPTDLQVLKALKSDLRTAHIPVVLLTNETKNERLLEIVKLGADAYITKPFSISMLEQTIQNLLDNRKMLKEHLLVELPTSLKEYPQKTRDKKLLAAFNAIIDQNIGNERFTINDLSEKLNISKMQLYRKIKPMIEMDINRYILNKRVQKAKYLMRDKQLSISEVAYQCGFSSPSYFSSAFKKILGSTPKEYRQKKG